MSKPTRGIVCPIMAVACTLSFAGMVYAAQFTADFGSSHYYRKGDNIRQEFPGLVMITRVDKAKGAMYNATIDLKMKTYYEKTTYDRYEVMFVTDPRTNIPHTWKRVGVEKVNGYECAKYVSPDSMRKRWICGKLHLIVRSESPQYGTMEYRNIREHPLSDSLFEVPSGYRKAN